MPSATNRPSVLPYLYLVIAAATWGGTWVLVRGVRKEFPPIAIAFWRWVAAAAILLPFAWPHLRTDWPKYEGHWPGVLVLGAIGTVTFAAFGALSVQHTTATNASMIKSITPIFCLLFSVLALHTRVTARYVVAMALSVAGMLCITTQGRIEALVSSVIAYVGWNHAAPRVGAHVAGLFGNLMPVFGIGLAVAFLGEIPQAYHGVGMALICSGLYLISRGK